MKNESVQQSTQQPSRPSTAIAVATSACIREVLDVNMDRRRRLTEGQHPCAGVISDQHPAVYPPLDDDLRASGSGLVASLIGHCPPNIGGCGGRGYLETEIGFGHVTHTVCPKCDGRGKVLRSDGARLLEWLSMVLRDAQLPDATPSMLEEFNRSEKAECAEDEKREAERWAREQAASRLKEAAASIAERIRRGEKVDPAELKKALGQ